MAVSSFDFCLILESPTTLGDTLHALISHRARVTHPYDTTAEKKRT